MEAIYSSAMLRNNLREVKDEATKDVVRITENGNAAFVFCSEAVFNRRIEAAVEDALYEYRVAEAVRRGREDRAAGRYVAGVDAALAEIQHRRELLNG